MRLILAVLASLTFTGLQAAPRVILPPPQANQWAWLNDADSPVHRFAMGLPVALDAAQDGQWIQQDYGALWSLILQAPGAQSLVLKLDQLQWPAQATLTLENARGQTLGPFTRQDVVEQLFVSPLIIGDSVTLQLWTPQRDTTQLRVSEVFYGARSPQRSKHGSCNIDVGSSQIPGHANKIDSTVLLQIGQNGGLGSCSGLLVNNVEEDRLPYVLTADHCGIDASNEQSVRVYWRFEDPTPECGNPPGHAERQPENRFSLQGVEMLADGDASDFTLMIVGRRNQPSAIPENFQPYWSGWDVRDTQPLSGVSVHHPSGDEKSISRFDSPAVAQITDIDGRQTNAWRVFWDLGTTEPGSSGAGLWNQNNLVVGVLSGGGASCQAQDQPDFFGRLTVAWEESNSCGGQLKCWLDPNNSGLQRLGGLGLPSRAKESAACMQPDDSGGGGSGALTHGLLLLLVLWSGRKRFIKPR